MQTLIIFISLAFAVWGTSTQAAILGSFQGPNGSWQLSSPAVGNIDADRDLELVVATRNNLGTWSLDAFDWSGGRISGFPYNAFTAPINVSPTLANIDEDPAAEILFTEGSHVVALKGNGTVLWKQPVTVQNYIPNAGFMAVTNGFYMTQTGLFQPQLPFSAGFFSEVSSPLVVDLEGNGDLEVVTGWKIDPDQLSANQDFNPTVNDIFGLSEWGATGEVWSGGVIIQDARTGAIKFIYHFHQLVEAGLAIAQLDDDPALEIVVLNDADSVVAFDVTEEPGFMGKGMLHGKFGKNIRLLSGTYQRGVDLQAADLDGDGYDEIFVGVSRIDPNWTPNETILDEDGSILWRDWSTPTSVKNVHGWMNSAALIPVNPNRDHQMDVLGVDHSGSVTFRYWNGVELVAHPGWPKSFHPEQPTTPVVADIDGDGQEEIIIGTYHPGESPSRGKLYVFGLGGEEKFALPVPSGIKQVPLVADVNQDGKNDLIFRSMDGHFHIHNYGGGTNISWGAHGGSSARTGNLGRQLYPSGTPLIVTRSNGFGRVSFTWKIEHGFAPDEVQIYAAERPSASFAQIASLPGDVRTFSRGGAPFGSQTLYFIAARYGELIRSSPPFPLQGDLNGNLLVNGGFEQDDDRGWDKWFSGNIPLEQMQGSSNNAVAGSRSMEVKLQNKGNNSSITQYSHYALSEDYLRVTPGKIYSFGGFIRTDQLSASSRHWFEWDSSKTAEATNNRPRLPWPNYFTPPFSPGTNSTRWVYLNRVFEMPAGFPNVELRHRLSAEAPVSGSIFMDNLFFRELPSPTDPRWQNLVSFGTRWRYMTSAQPENWVSRGFNDSAWLEGLAKFGAGAAQNVKTTLPKNQPAYYFRTTFVVTNTACEELLLAATCTDDYGGTVYGLSMWLNGEVVSEKGIEAVTGDGNSVRYYDLTPFAHLLQPGTNTVAFQLNNTWQPTWDNIAFDVSLRIIPSPHVNPSSRIESIGRAPDGSLELVVGASAASVWRLQYSTNNAAAGWQDLQIVQFTTPGTKIVRDRSFTPGALSQGYYRLYHQN